MLSRLRVPEAKTVLCASVAAVGCCTLAALRFSRQIYVSREVIDAYATFRGKLRFYFVVLKPVIGHVFVVVRPSGDDAQHSPVAVHLFLRGLEWSAAAVLAKGGWRPGRRTVHESVHDYCLHSALACLARACREHSVYEWVWNNCRTFSRNMVKSFRLYPPTEAENAAVPFDEHKLVRALGDHFGFCLATTTDAVLGELIAQRWWTPLLSGLWPLNLLWTCSPKLGHQHPTQVLGFFFSFLF